MAKIEEKVEDIISSELKSEGYEIYDVEYVKEGKDYYLRIFIEKPKGTITLEDCEKVNDIVNPILDEKDVIKDQYFLEVSSTGIEKNLRKTKHYEKALGEKVKIKLFKKDEKGRKEIQGILKKITSKEITIEKDGETVNVELNNIAQAKTVYDREKNSKCE